MQLLRSYWWILLLMLIVVVLAIKLIPSGFRDYIPPGNPGDFSWDPPDSNRIPHTPAGDYIRYGKELVANTAVYLGPKGKVAAISNGMNCQNCHLQAGTKYYGNNYSAVYATYPRFRARSGTVENLDKRVNDCMERSLNGKALDTGSFEMKAFKAYINWLGQAVPKNIIPPGTGIADLPLLDRAADSARGKSVFIQKCKRCHGIDGQGQLNRDGNAYTYPPLWGNQSFNTGAGLFRISRFAGYVRFNMPFDVSAEIPGLTDEEAWDVAAYVVSQPRPSKKFNGDWPDIAKKPFDHPFGPYIDSFTELQHKYGPYREMKSRK